MMHTYCAGEGGGDAGGGGGGAATPPSAPASQPGGTPPAPTPKPAGEPKPGTPAPTESPKPGEQKTPGGTEKPPDAKEAAAAYDVRRPESIKQDDPLWAGFTAKAKEAGVPAEHASAIAEWFASETAKAEKAAAQQWDETKQGWQKSLTEKYGQKLDEAKKVAQAGVLAAGGPGLVKALAELDLADHPDLFAAFHKVGEMTREDSSRVPTSRDTPALTREQRLAKFYDHPTSRSAR